MRGVAGWCFDFLTSTDVGSRVPAEIEDTVGNVSETELREWEGEQGAGAEEPRARGGGGSPLFLPTLDLMATTVDG